jgi:hypothetical protein
MHDLFTLHHASRWTRLRKLMFPASLPALFTGLRISAGLSVIGAIVGDFFFGRGEIGIGQLLLRYANRLQGEQLLASIIVSSALGVAVFLFFGWLQDRVTGAWDDTGAGMRASRRQRPGTETRRGIDAKFTKPNVAPTSDRPALVVVACGGDDGGLHDAGCAPTSVTSRSVRPMSARTRSSSRPTGSPRPSTAARISSSGDDYVVDVENQTVTGSLVAGGETRVSTSRYGPGVRRSGSSRSRRRCTPSRRSTSASSPPTRRPRSPTTRRRSRSSLRWRRTRRSSCGIPRPIPRSRRSPISVRLGVTINVFAGGTFSEVLVAQGTCRTLTRSIRRTTAARPASSPRGGDRPAGVRVCRAVQLRVRVRRLGQAGGFRTDPRRRVPGVQPGAGGPGRRDRDAPSVSRTARADHAAGGGRLRRTIRTA